MKIVLYGLPCAGKTTLLSALNDIKVVNGSHELNRLSGGSFSKLSETEKQAIRVQYTQYLTSLNEEIILSDGHYSFLDKVVFTDADARVYDVFLYLYCSPETLLARYQTSEKNQNYTALNTSIVDDWQRFEIENLRSVCHRQNKDFYVLNSANTTPDALISFVRKIQNGFSSYHLAQQLVLKIKEHYPEPCELHIADGDKTIIRQDSFRMCSDCSTSAFDGDFYTGYQSLLFSEEVKELPFDYDRINNIELNSVVFDKIKGHNYVILSSGITMLWDKISHTFGITPVLAEPLISADTKYFVVKLLQQLGYTIRAYGDSRNDIYMLRAADTGYLYIGSRLSKSLKGTNVKDLTLLYDKTPCILAEHMYEALAEDISICKSNSGFNGALLSAAHLRLGQTMGRVIRETIPEASTAVIILDRGGRFFGDGLYSTFGGTLYPYNPAKDELPKLHHRIAVAVIVDSVINTGRSLQRLIAALEQQYPDITIVLATNVVQRGSIDRFNKYKLFAIRASDNSFVGKNQPTQYGKSGPDTADRLFNLIQGPFDFVT